MATINVNEIMKKIAPAIIRSRQNLALGAALSKFNRLKKDLLIEFNDHAVTKEIESAETGGNPETAENSSGLLDGKGNLFTFLGFNRDRKPIKEVRSLLNDNISLNNKPRFEIQNDSVLFSFGVNIPDEHKILEKTKMDWENTSWVEGIEKGVSGFSNYIYWKKFSNPPSRSGGGVQADRQLRDASMKTTNYLLDMLKRFKGEIT